VIPGTVDIDFITKVTQLPYNNNMIKSISIIANFEGTWKYLYKQHATLFEEILRREAKMANIGSSTRIEGSRMSNEGVARLLDASDPQQQDIVMKEFRPQDVSEVLGCALAYTYIDENWHSIVLTEEFILRLHDMLLSESNKDTSHRGKYKTVDNSVIAYDADGKIQEIWLQTTSAKETPREMKSLLAWYHRETKRNYLHPLLKIGIFIVTWLKIHPFEDGNGRLSRLLTYFLLLQHGYDFNRYSAMDREIEKAQMLYYQALRQTQRTLDSSNKPDWITWLDYFLQIIVLQIKTLKEKVNV
jgi:Fic family protein